MSGAVTTTCSPPTTTISQTLPIPSALTTLLSTPSTSTFTSNSASAQIPPATALPVEILHNLRHQHCWTDLRLHPPPQLHQQSALSASTFSLLAPIQNFLPKDIALKPSVSDLDLTYPDISTSQDENPQQPTPRARSPPSSSSFHPPNTPSQPTTTASTNVNVTLLSGKPPKALYTHPDLQRKLLKASIPESSLKPEREWVIPTTVARTWTLRELCAVFDSLPARVTVRAVQKPNEEGSFGGNTTGRESCFEDNEGDDDNDEENEQGREGGEGLEGEGNRKRDRKSESERKKTNSGAAKGGRRGGYAKEGEKRATVMHQDAKRVLLAMKAHEGRGGDGTIVYYIVQEGEVKPRQN